MDFSKRIMYGKRTLLFTAMVFCVSWNMYRHVYARVCGDTETRFHRSKNAECGGRIRTGTCGCKPERI